MLQSANTEICNPLGTKAYNCECQNLPYNLQIKQVKVNLKLNWRIFMFCTLGTNGLIYSVFYIVEASQRGDGCFDAANFLEDQHLLFSSNCPR